MRETCSQSAAYVNMLMTILYNAKWARVVNEWCPHGKSQRIGQSYNMFNSKRNVCVLCWTTTQLELNYNMNAS